MNPVLAVVIFLVGLFVVAIGLHEFGHYWTAKRFGMRADKFFLGFGPTLWSTRRGETEFGVKALPLGGFVRIKGMSPLDERLRPVADQVFDPESVAEDRRAVAAETGQDVTQVAATPDVTWQRLDVELFERGVDRETRAVLLERSEAAAGSAPTPSEARTAFNAVARETLTDTGRIGDMHHRVLEGDRGRFFHDRPAWQRAIVLVAGSTMHFVIALVLLFVAFAFWGDVVTEPQVGAIIDQIQAEPGCDPAADGCLISTPAAAAGLQVGDRILSIDGTPIEDFDQVQALLSARPGEQTTLVVDRGGAREELSLTPVGIEECDQDGVCAVVGKVGFQATQRTTGLPLGTALREATTGPGGFFTVFGQTIGQIGKVFGPEGFANIFSTVSGDQVRDVESPASPIGIGRTTYQLAEDYGPYMVLAILALVNVFVGIFNLVPLPPLDGGHLAVVGIEKVVNTVRKTRGMSADFTIDPRAVTAVAIPVVLLLGTMFFSVLWLDLVNPIDLR